MIIQESKEPPQLLPSKERLGYIDILRIIAILLVIYNHTNDRGFKWFMNFDQGMAIWMWDTFMAIIWRTCIPIFFMLSGATLLGKSEDIKNTYKRIPKILIDLIIFSTFYQILNRIHEGLSLSFLSIARSIINSSIWHMWYLYAYIAFLITLPIMSQMVKGIDDQHFKLLLLIIILFDVIIPVVEKLIIPIEASIKPTWITEILFMYPMAGYYLDKRMDIGRVTYKYLGIIWLIFVLSASINILCEYKYLVNNPHSDALQVFFSFCYASTLFLTIKKCFARGIKNRKIHTFIGETGKCVFGVYLIHIIVMHIWFRFTKGVFESYLGIYMSCFVIFGISCIITHVMRKIPVIKRML